MKTLPLNNPDVLEAMLKDLFTVFDKPGVIGLGFERRRLGIHFQNLGASDDFPSNSIGNGILARLAVDSVKAFESFVALRGDGVEFLHVSNRDLLPLLDIPRSVQSCAESGFVEGQIGIWSAALSDTRKRSSIYAPQPYVTKELTYVGVEIDL
jgi:hypothetical protein